MGVMRTILLGLAGSPTCRRLVTRLPVSRRVVARFVPGERLEDALTAVAAVNAAGMTATLNPLGENVTDEHDALSAARDYVEILDRIADAGLDCNVSVKLTMLGLDLGPEVAIANLRRVLEAARRHGSFVRIDMESSSYVDPTLAIWRDLRLEYPGVGLVIQSYLMRSAADVERLIEEGAAIRLVKGAYNEPSDIAFGDKAEVDRAFVRLLERLSEPDAREADVRVAVASHDPAMVARARHLIDAGHLPDGEFQMLYGIGTPLQRELVAAGYRVRVYISYGPNWYPWFMRRLAERPANLAFFVRHLFG